MTNGLLAAEKLNRQEIRTFHQNNRVPPFKILLNSLNFMNLSGNMC